MDIPYSNSLFVLRCISDHLLVHWSVCPLDANCSKGVTMGYLSPWCHNENIRRVSRTHFQNLCQTICIIIEANVYPYIPIVLSKEALIRF